MNFGLNDFPNNTRVIDKVLTGYLSGAGTVFATDSILGAIQKINGNIDLKIPYTGATADVDLGIQSLSSDGTLNAGAGVNSFNGNGINTFEGPNISSSASRWTAYADFASGLPAMNFRDLLSSNPLVALGLVSDGSNNRVIVNGSDTSGGSTDNGSNTLQVNGTFYSSDGLEVGNTGILGVSELANTYIDKNGNAKFTSTLAVSTPISSAYADYPVTLSFTTTFLGITPSSIGGAETDFGDYIYDDGSGNVLRGVDDEIIGTIDYTSGIYTDISGDQITTFTYITSNYQLFNVNSAGNVFSSRLEIGNSGSLGLLGTANAIITGGGNITTLGSIYTEGITTSIGGLEIGNTGTLGTYTNSNFVIDGTGIINWDNGLKAILHTADFSSYWTFNSPSTSGGQDITREGGYVYLDARGNYGWFTVYHQWSNINVPANAGIQTSPWGLSDYDTMTVGVQATTTYGTRAQLYVQNRGDYNSLNVPTLKLQNFSTQTADTLQLTNSSGTTLTTFSSAGLLNKFAGIADGVNIAVGTATGTKIGTATTQKLGFFNATPIAQVANTTEIGAVLSSLGLRASGTAYPITTSGAITFGSLTAGRVTFAGTAGLLTDDADMTFATDTLSVTKIAVKAGTSSGNAARVGGVIFDQFADSTVGGAEADIYTNTLIANVFGANGDKVTASYGGNFVTVGTEITQLKVYFAGTAIWDSTGVAPTTGTTSWNVEVKLIRVSSTAVRYTVTLNTTSASGFVYAVSGEITGLTLSGTNILKITGASSGIGSGAGDIVGKMGYITFMPAA